jgi:hypothetical protein
MPFQAGMEKIQPRGLGAIPTFFKSTRIIARVLVGAYGIDGGCVRGKLRKMIPTNELPKNSRSQPPF